MGNNKIVRICTDKSFNRNSLMIAAFASEISRSKRLRKYTFTSSSEISHTEEALQVGKKIYFLRVHTIPCFLT
jgi:hypothetical protein